VNSFYIKHIPASRLMIVSRRPTAAVDTGQPFRAVRFVPDWGLVGAVHAVYSGITSSKLNPGAVDTITVVGRGHGMSAMLKRATIVYC